MKQQTVNFKVVPDERRKKNDNRFPLKLRVTYKGKRKYFGTGLSASDEEWLAINEINAKGNHRKIKLEIAAVEKSAGECADKITPFSFIKFENEFFGKKLAFETVEAAYQTYITQLKENHQDGTASNYDTSIKSLLRFKPKLTFDEITPAFLQGFERWMLDNGKSITTVGIYLRPLRCIFNLAKENGIVSPETYPFGKRKYIIPSGKNVKKSLTIEQIKQIFNYPVEENSTAARAKDFWIFSYLCNGINFMDVAYLRWSDIDKETIAFERSKTKRTRRSNPIKIIALRNDYINSVLKKWSTNQNDGFVFQIISSTDSSAVARLKVQQFTKLTNEYMKAMGENLGFEIKLTTYVARHSFATILVRSGAPLAFASQSLGHSNVLTTQKYFAGFDLKTQEEYAKALTAF